MGGDVWHHRLVSDQTEDYPLRETFTLVEALHIAADQAGEAAETISRLQHEVLELTQRLALSQQAEREVWDSWQASRHYARLREYRLRTHRAEHRAEELESKLAEIRGIVGSPNDGKV